MQGGTEKPWTGALSRTRAEINGPPSREESQKAGSSLMADCHGRETSQEKNTSIKEKNGPGEGKKSSMGGSEKDFSGRRGEVWNFIKTSDE